MTIEEIKELIQLFNESGVAEIEVQRGENRLRLRRAPLRQEYVFPAMTAPSAQAPSMSAPPPMGGATGSAAAAAPAKIVDTDHILVKSPIVGTYSSQPSPAPLP